MHLRRTGLYALALFLLDPGLRKFLCRECIFEDDGNKKIEVVGQFGDCDHIFRYVSILE